MSNELDRHYVYITYYVMYARSTSFRGAKKCKIKENGVFLVILTNFGKDMTDKLRKMHAKTRIQGLYLIIFIPEKYVFRVCFESPFTRMISSLNYKWRLYEGFRARREGCKCIFAFFEI